MTSSRVTVQFAGDDAGTSVPRVQITGHPGISWADQGIPFRVYPPGCVIKASAGTTKTDSVRQVDVPGDMVSFSGSSASLRYAPETTPTVELVWGFDDEGNQVSDVSFTVNNVTGQIRASKSFQGLVRVGEYKTSYELIWYQPESRLQAVLGSQMPAVHVEYGVLAAYKNKGMAIHQVEIPEVTQATDKIELWRVTSKTVIDPSGEWEYPPNWETYSGTYPDGKPGPDKDSSVVKERVHELGYMTKSGGAVWYDQFPKTLLKPYDGVTVLIRNAATPGFQPQVDFRFQNAADQFLQYPGRAQAAQQAISERQLQPKIR